MDENQQEQLKKIMQAVKSLQKSTTRSVQTGMVEGTGKLLIRSYENLHKQLTNLMPDDEFLTTLTLEVDAETSDQEIAGQVQFLTSQLQETLRDSIRSHSIPGNMESTWNFDFNELMSDTSRLKSIGREIQEQVMGLTRNTLKRALTNIEVQFSEGGDFRYAYLEHEDFSAKNMPGMDFRKAVLIHTKFMGANMANSDLRKSYLAHVNMTGVNLAGSDLRKIVIKDSNLTGVNLDKSELRRVSIFDSNLKGVNLGRSVLDGALLVNCDLNGINLKDASTRNVTLHNVSLKNAMMPDGKRYQEGMELSAYGIEIASGPTPPPPPIPPKPAEAPEPPHAPGEFDEGEKPKRKVKITINHDDDPVQAEFEELEEEMDALEIEMDDLDMELDSLHDHISRESDKAREEISGRRAELERRRQHIEAELAELDDEE